MPHEILPIGSTVKGQSIGRTVALLPVGSMPGGRPQKEPKKPTELGERILSKCKDRGFTQTSLERKLVEMSLAGAKAKFHQGYLSRLIYGDRGQTAVDPYKLEMISDVLDVDYHWLATGRPPTSLDDDTPRAVASRFARSFGAREDAIDHVAELPDIPGADAKYWLDLITAESEARRRAHVPERPKTFQKDVRRQHDRKRRQAAKVAAETPSQVPPAPRSVPRKVAG